MPTYMNLAAPGAPLGDALAGVVNSLYSGDGERKRAERQAAIDAKNAQTELARAKVADFQRKKADSEAALRTRAMGPADLANAMFGESRGPEALGYFNGDVVKPQPETAEQPGIIGGYEAPRPDFVTPDAERRFRDLRVGTVVSNQLPGKTKYNDLTAGMGHLQDQDIVAQALAGALSPEQQAALAGARSKPVYKATASGQVLDQFGGGVQETPLSQAIEAARTGAAAASNATAGLRNAQTEKTRSEILPQVQVPIPGGAPGQAVPALGRDVSRAVTAKAYGPNSGMTMGDPTKSGQEFLATLDPGTANVVKGIAEGRVPITSLSTRGGHREEVLKLVSQYNPMFNAAKFPQYQAVQKDFTSGLSARNVTAINTAVAHMGTLSELFKAMNNSDIPAYNAVANRIKAQFGDAAVTNPSVAAGAVANELMRVFRQVGASEAETKDWEQRFRSAGSPEQQQQALQVAAKLLEGRILAVDDQWRRGMDTPNGYPLLLSPISDATLRSLGVVRQAAPAAAPAAPAGGAKSFATEAEAAAAAASGALRAGERVTIGGVSGTWR